jgi:hypothetical protein
VSIVCSEMLIKHEPRTRSASLDEQTRREEEERAVSVLWLSGGLGGPWQRVGLIK